MKRGTTGDWMTTSTVGEPVSAFVPKPLPPSPPLQLEGPLRSALDEALLALGRLDSVTTLLPDPALFLFTYVRKEAVLSSQIEGTQSSLSDLLLFELDEAPGVPMADVQEVSCYVAALEHGLRRLREGFPHSNRLIREIHGQLLARGRGKEKQPGEFRTSQNWIGGPRPGLAIYVPPPADRVQECMADLERFLHEPAERIPVLVKAALAHVQFETVHPFLDGNGRVGRLLIGLLLSSEGVLREPLLYLSLYFKAHRATYYDLLQRVRLDGDWEAWLQFFAEGVRETAEGAVSTARRIVDLFERDRAQIHGHQRAVGSALRVHRALEQRPVASIPLLVRNTGLSAPTVSAALRMLEGLGIVREITGKRRNRVFGYDRYVALLSEGTQP
jgi:Fic family protein